MNLIRSLSRSIDHWQRGLVVIVFSLVSIGLLPTPAITLVANIFMLEVPAAYCPRLFLLPQAKIMMTHSVAGLQI